MFVDWIFVLIFLFFHEIRFSEKGFIVEEFLDFKSGRGQFFRHEADIFLTEFIYLA